MEKKTFYTYRSNHTSNAEAVEAEQDQFESIREYLDSLTKPKAE